MLESDAELNSASNGDRFEGGGVIGQKKGVRVRVKAYWWDPHILTLPLFLPDGPPWKYYHSIENLILHLAQAFRTLAQVYERMSEEILESAAYFPYVKK